MDAIKPRVVVSRCIEFDRCRYNGDMISSDVVRALKRHVDFVPVCAEVEIGLGVPRDPIRVASFRDGLRLVQPSPELDVTERMKRFAAFSLLPLFALALLSCGGDGLSLFPRSDASELTIAGPEDGAVYTSTQPLALQIGTSDPAGHPDLEVLVTLLDRAGLTVWEQRLTGPAPNEDLGLQLPDLDAGRYQLTVTVFQDGEQVEQRTTTIFSTRERPRIAGIASFPPLITASSPVLLSAEIAADTDPWLRWTWRGKTIAEGSASSGTAAVLWKAPADAGVYTVTLEIFPAAPPAGAGFSFRSPIAMSTDIYVSASGTAVRDELGPAASYLSLFHLQADFADAAAAARDLKRAGTPIGSPTVVPVGEGFGYRLDSGDGFQVPWPMLPVVHRSPLRGFLHSR